MSAEAGGTSSVHVDHGCGMTMEDHGGGGASLAGHSVDGDDDFITMDDFIEDVDGSGDDEDGEVALDDPKDTRFFEDFF